MDNFSIPKGIWLLLNSVIPSHVGTAKMGFVPHSPILLVYLGHRAQSLAGLAALLHESAMAVNYGCWTQW